MNMTRTLAALALALALPVGHMALAQDTSTTAPATDTTAPAADTAGDKTKANDLSMGSTEGDAPADGVGQNYTREAFDSWQLNCVKSADGKNEPCQLYQLLKDKDGNAVAEINLVALPDGGKAVAGATIITPLETLLTEQLRLTIDDGKAKLYPFTFCAGIGCIARVGFTGEEVDALKKGAKATMSIVPMAAPDKKVDLDVSLKGFTAGFDAVSAANLAPKK